MIIYREKYKDITSFIKTGVMVLFSVFFYASRDTLSTLNTMFVEAGVSVVLGARTHVLVHNFHEFLH
jgi:hypothetical protein